MSTAANHVSIQCPNCGGNVAAGQDYCASCGQKRIAARLTMHEIGHDLAHVLFHFDNRVLSLVRSLLVRPGAVALEYVRGRRNRYFGPFAFLLLVATVNFIVVELTGFHVVMTNKPNVVADLLEKHINLLMFAGVPLLAAFSRLLDARDGFNFAEHLVLAAYTTAMGNLFLTVVVIPAWLLFRSGDSTEMRLLFAFLPIWLMYFGFAASGFYHGKRALSWCKGVAAAFLAQVSMQVITSLITYLLLRSVA
jgi:hypothetical protein